jgi:hypothetical protein
MSGSPPRPGEAGPPKGAEDKKTSSIIDMLMRGAQASLDGIEEPTAADLAALDDLDEIDTTLKDSIELQPALALLAKVEEPEFVSLEGLDDIEAPETPDGELEDVEELLEDVESLMEDYIDVDLDDVELDDEGYDLDEDDISSYHDLYGDDDTIIPSFREGEFAEEEDGDTDYYNELR